jgi:hypothetical protein
MRGFLVLVFILIVLSEFGPLTAGVRAGFAWVGEMMLVVVKTPLPGNTFRAPPTLSHSDLHSSGKEPTDIGVIEDDRRTGVPRCQTTTPA